jgi:hypothetical protein
MPVWSLGTRLKEHQNAVSTALAEHVCDTKYKIAWKNSKVITTNNRYGQRLGVEALHINMSNHAIGMTVSICQRNTGILLAGDVIPCVFKKPRLHL